MVSRTEATDQELTFLSDRCTAFTERTRQLWSTDLVARLDVW
jgi:hypothetical protein